MEEEIKEERLDSPLVVHKKSDASYQETASEMGMSSTHTDEEDEDTPTLERHRFKKNKKKKWPWVLLAVIAVAVAVICALYYSGVINFADEKTTASTRKTYITQTSDDFKNTITVKGTYIFFEGEEIDGIQELDRSVKYLDDGTKLIIQDENADEDFLNFQVLSLLSEYNIDYEITHIVSSGLISKYETTAQPSSATQSAEKTTVAEKQATEASAD